MRGIPIDVPIDYFDFDHVPRPVIASSSNYPDGHVVEYHQHRRGQLISGATGVMVLTTPNGTWVMPPQRGMWIPPGTKHRVRMVGAVTMESLYTEPDAVFDMPSCCQVVGISLFMRCLLKEALDLPLEYELGGRAGTLMELIQYEMRLLQPLPLSLHYPESGSLAERCRAFIERPNIHETVDDWSHALGMHRRTFTRFFRQRTGLSFMAWRQQACLLSAMSRLATGEPVTTVALDLGYDNPASFTVMFKRTVGAPPLTYLSVARGLADNDGNKTDALSNSRDTSAAKK